MSFIATFIYIEIQFYKYAENSFRRNGVSISNGGGGREREILCQAPFCSEKRSALHLSNAFNRGKKLLASRRVLTCMLQRKQSSLLNYTHFHPCQSHAILFQQVNWVINSRTHLP